MNEELEKLLAAEVDKHVDAVAMPDDLVRTAREYGETRDLLDRVSKYKDDLKEKCENFMRVLVPAMESAGIKSINIEGLGRVGTASDNTPKVVDDDLLHEWLYQQGETGSTLALALLVCGCVFTAMSGPALSLHVRSEAFHQTMASLAPRSRPSR